MRRTIEIQQAGPVPGTVPGRPGPAGARCEAFIRGLYEEHGALLVRFATRLLGGDRHRAEDILQEAAVRAWRHSGTLGTQTKGLRPWLFTVVRNLVIDDQRSRRAASTASEPFEQAELPVADEVERTLTSHVVTQAMRDLSERQREVLIHMYFLGNSVAQTAEALGVPPGTVKSRTYYAMRALRAALEVRGVEC
ncbi:RNA polymerase [Streptomyces carminius]|uniref:RNA polymerase n=1 Tax=Streptomyces carminius TaxID=2665496 RepID=A0A2M8LTT7_9ACTN|nr:sigma-70 family RNA polymerase sigma factor [Streptomyces carminius]PJE95364.1 RNA polymerase [Streptomyces carminius]